MGRAGIKRRKGSRPQHLAKVGTSGNDRAAVHREQRAVMDTMGVHGKGWASWVAGALLVVMVVGGMLAWIFVT